MTDLAVSLVGVTSALDRAGIPYMVIGGFANLVWGEPRTTMDVDITVDIHGLGLDAFASWASTVGEVLIDDPVAFAERARVLPVRTEQGLSVDFILATLPFELAAIGRARPVRIEGTDVRVCGPEDFIIHKVISERARDHEDIVGVLKRQAGNLDLAALDAAVVALASNLDPQIAARFAGAKRAAGVETG